MSNHLATRNDDDQPLLDDHDTDEITSENDNTLLDSDVIVRHIGDDPSIAVKSTICCGKLSIFTVILLTGVNLINYIDRYTIAGKDTFIFYFFYRCALIRLIYNYTLTSI